MPTKAKMDEPVSRSDFDRFASENADRVSRDELAAVERNLTRAIEGVAASNLQANRETREEQRHFRGEILGALNELRQEGIRRESRRFDWTPAGIVVTIILFVIGGFVTMLHWGASGRIDGTERRLDEHRQAWIQIDDRLRSAEIELGSRP